MTISVGPPEPPAGWSAPTAADSELCGRLYNFVVVDISRPVEVLPPGYPAYTAVLHRLVDDSRGRWLTREENDAWSRVREIQDQDIAHHTHGTDVPLWSDPATAHGLRDALRVGPGTGPFVVMGHLGCFAGRFDHQVTGTVLHRWLTDQKDPEYGPAGRLTLWFPTDRAWVANAPFDMGITYIASDEATAERLLAHPDLEALSCHTG